MSLPVRNGVISIPPWPIPCPGNETAKWMVTPKTFERLVVLLAAEWGKPEDEARTIAAEWIEAFGTVAP